MNERKFDAYDLREYVCTCIYECAVKNVQKCFLKTHEHIASIRGGRCNICEGLDKNTNYTTFNAHMMWIFIAYWRHIFNPASTNTPALIYTQ